MLPLLRLQEKINYFCVVCINRFYIKFGRGFCPMIIDRLVSVVLVFKWKKIFFPH